MADKVRITADRVISKARNKVKFYADDGGILTMSSKEVAVFNTQEELDQDIADEANESVHTDPVAGDEDSQEAQIGDETPISNDEQQGDEPAPAAASRSSKSKRSKGKGKEQMATASKKKAAKKAVKKASNGALIRTVAGREHDISGYEKVKNASGHTSYDNGDEVATKLRGKTLDEVYAQAAKMLKEPEKDLRAKYKNLNPGMQRMSLGNRMRKIVNAKAAA
jgi:hypothetical protein